MPANEANGKNSLPGSTTANKIVTGINSNDTTNVAGCPITKAGLIPIFKPTAPLNFLAIRFAGSVRNGFQPFDEQAGNTGNQLHYRSHLDT